MKEWLRGFYFSFPVQLLFLHFRKYQVLLIFWFILFGTINGTFMHGFGADSLYLSPEYLGSVNAIGSGIVGMSVGMFIMSWNITTFILFSKNFKFLAATTNPFLKYCLNNSVIPLAFLFFYFFKAYHFDRHKELMGDKEILLLTGGFLAGFVLMLIVSFIYFFRADKNILRRLLPIISNPNEYITYRGAGSEEKNNGSLMRVDWYLNTPLSIHKTRDVSHYTQLFIDTVFKRHHFAAVLSVFFAFLFLIMIGFFLETKFFQIPAAASITIFFAILIGVSGAFAYFMQSWSIPYLIALILALNIFYKLDWIDPRNKAYGVNYINKEERPHYNREALRLMCSPENIKADSLQMISILENWKKNQPEEKPLFTVLAASGGGNRSATFTMRTLQQLDSVSRGEAMKRIFLITGSSGGMIGAAYFRELYYRRLTDATFNLQDQKYVDDIAGDLLNPLFSSFVARDLISPAHKFKVDENEYVKDRAYAFESKLSENTRGFLNKHLEDYKKPEQNAEIPLIFFNSVITQDGRKLVTSPHTLRFMMKPVQADTSIFYSNPDVVDFSSFFQKQNPGRLRVLTALRMNATFPIVLPSVWLPSKPVIDVMDAGLRDNYGLETVLRFLDFFEDWVKQNTRGVLIIQLRDRPPGGWEQPYQSNDISDHITKPFLLLQHNWNKMMEYSQNDLLSYYSDNRGHPVYKVNFLYASANPESKAALNFHLTQREKNDIVNSVNSDFNRQSFRRVLDLFNNLPEEKVINPDE